MKTIIKFIAPAALLFLVDLVLPLTLSAYVLTMMLCVLPLLWLSRHEGWNRSLLLLPWSVAFMASILVTRNFVYPDIQTARNTDVNILELSSLTADSTGQKKVLRVNFPKHGPEDAGQRFNALVSSDIDQIMDEDVDAAFHFYDRERKLNLDFSGTISYTVGDFRQPLNAVMEVDSLSLAAQGWNLKIHDLRDTVKPVWCLVLIMAMFLFMLVMLFNGSCSSTASMLGVWLFFAVAMVSRLYDAMRMAYYPPLGSKDYIFQRYRSLVLDDPMNNPLLATVVMVLLMMGLTVFFRKLSYRTQLTDPSIAMRRLKIVFVAMAVSIALNFLGIGRVISHICLPVSLFFLAKYYCLRIDNRYLIPCHFTSYALTLFAIGKGDPGFAIIWMEFLLIWSLLLINVYRSSSNQISMWKDGLWLVRLPIAACLFVLLFFPQYAVLTVCENPLWAFCFLVVVGIMILCSIWIAGLVRRPKWIVIAVGGVIIMASFLSFGASVALKDKGSIINRAQSIAGVDINNLLLKETVSGTKHVFSATQNAWYLSENMKAGMKRVFAPGIYSIQPHSSQIVSYGTQMSDVLVSRHFILEVSILYPILLTLMLALVFALVCVRRDDSHRHKVLTMGIALFVLIEAVYVLLCNLNLALFVGQDYSLLSGKVKLLLEVLLLAYLTYPCEEAEYEEESEGLTLRQGAETVCSPATAKCLIVILLLTSGVLYAFSPLEAGTTPVAFSGKKALVQVQKELAPLNELLRTSNIPKHALQNGEDVSQLWAALTDSIDMKQTTAGMSNLGRSMISLFDQQLKYRNKADTLVFLSLDPKTGYQLKVNEYQWNYELPNFNQQRWHGNILEKYSMPVEVASTSDNTAIPEGWQPKGEIVMEHRKLVRAICINGKDQTFYSLRDPWLRNVISAARCTLDGQENLTLTLDGTLQERINDWLRRSHTTSSVVVVNGLGEVMALGQNNPSAAVDPNDETAFTNQRISKALGGKDEESLLKNLNFDVMNPGVGSSIKPVTAACAISMLGLRFDQFRIQSLGLSPDVRIREERNGQKLKKYYQTWRFGSYRFFSKWPFESLVGDETGGDDREVSFEEFLSKSSNYYHATLLTMLLDNGGNIERLFHDASETDIPQVLFGPYRLGLNVSSVNIKDSYLSYCLEENFGFGNTHAHDDFLGPLTTDKTKELFPLTYPRCAVLNETALHEMAPSTKLQRLSTGSVEAYSLSPFQMAELYAKIASGHSDFTCSLVPRDKTFNCLFRNYRGEEDSLIYQSFRNYLFPAMRECCISGTASRWHLDNLWQHVYAKTGTLANLNREDDRMLAIILADRPLENAEPGEARFVVAYIRYQKSALQNIDQIVREIIGSRGFAEYMTLNE